MIVKKVAVVSENLKRRLRQRIGIEQTVLPGRGYNRLQNQI